MMESRILRRVEHLGGIFRAILEYVWLGHRFRMRSGGDGRGNLVMTMTVEEPEKLTEILEPPQESVDGVGPGESSR